MLFNHLFYWVYAWNVSESFTKFNESVIYLQIVLFMKVLIKNRDIEVYLNIGLQVLLKQRLQGLAFMIIEQTIWSLTFAEYSFIFNVIHDFLVIYDDSNEILGDKAFTLLDYLLKLS